MSDELKQKVLSWMQGVGALNVAYVGVANRLFDALARLENATAPELAAAAGVDSSYTTRWCDAAYAFELLDAEGDRFRLSALGRAFLSAAPGTLMAFPVNAVLGAHMAERAAGLMPSGERPGEKVLAERPTVLPLFGPMLENTFAPMFEAEVLAKIPIYAEVDARAGLVIDLGCGNGWYLRALARRERQLRGVGLDGFDENVWQATELARAEGLGDRLRFAHGDIHDFGIDEVADLIAMNRTLHHVWDRGENVMRILSSHLRPGGAAVIWEPRWPDDRAKLRQPRTRGMAFQNLAEHVQGNHFLRPKEIAEAMRAAGLRPEVYELAGGDEMVVVGHKPG